jgi:hypothetical protein
MAENTYQPAFNSQPAFSTMSDIGTDYALIAAGVTAALVALVYLLLI